MKSMKSDAFVEAVHSRSRELMEQALAPDVSFFSPVAFSAYEGRDLVVTILAEGAMKVFGDDFRYTDRFENEDSAALIFTASVGGREVDGLDLLRFDEEGLVTELKVMLRPRSGLEAMASAMAERFEALGLIGSSQT